MGVRLNMAETLYESGSWDEMLSVTDQVITWAHAQQGGSRRFRHS
jgi:hypothetical protein